MSRFTVERCLYPPTVIRGEDGREVPYDLYHVTMRDNVVGDILCHHVAAPGTGFVRYRITRMDESGVWAVVHEDRSRMLTLGDVI